MKHKKAIAPSFLNKIETPTKAFTLPKLDLPLLENDENDYLQQGGRSQALQCFSSFLQERGKHYSYNMSSPLTAFSSCSRLSPHITFGTVSLREIVQKNTKTRNRSLIRNA